MPSSAAFPVFVTSFSYLGIFIFFALLDQFIPILEEAMLLSIGYVSAIGILNPFITILISALSLLFADISFYFLARSGSRYISHLQRGITKKIIEKQRVKMQENMFRTLFFLTILPKIRFFGPVLAGASKISFKKFLLSDSVILTLFCSFYIAIGFFFNKQMALLFVELKPLQHTIFGITLIFVIVSFGLIVRSILKNKSRSFE